MSVVKAQIRNIENGLVEFTSPVNIFQASGTNASALHTLPERMAFYKVPGVSIAVVKDFEIEWSKAYGVKSIDSNSPITPETLFEAASSTKLLTAVIALHLVEGGLLDLDVNVNEFLSSWKISEGVYSKEQNVTLRLLLTHQAGINPPEGGFSWDEGGMATLAQILNGEAPAQNHPAKLEFVPGSKWQYSNLGYVLIQLLIEDVLGKSFPQVAQELVFEALGMSSSTMLSPLSEDFDGRVALPHDSEGYAHQQQLVPTAVAQGGLLTTPRDFSIFMIEIMRSYQGQSNQILSKEMMRRMFNAELELAPDILGVPLGQGLGVFLYSQGNNLLFLHPGGNLPGANCWPIGAPDLGKATVIMTNGALGELLGMEIIHAIMREYGWLESSQQVNKINP